MSIPDLDERRHITLVLAGVFLFVVVGGAVDLYLDRPPTLLSVHVVFELLVLAASLGGAAYLGLGWYTTRGTLSAVALESEHREFERREWERRASELLAGFGHAIASQFDLWHLTPTERRVGLMLLQGHSHKRIAMLTETSERTVRQHSVAVYKKAGLAGRAELAGFFLNALDLPDPTDR